MNISYIFFSLFKLKQRARIYTNNTLIIGLAKEKKCKIKSQQKIKK